MDNWIVLAKAATILLICRSIRCYFEDGSLIGIGAKIAQRAEKVKVHFKPLLGKLFSTSCLRLSPGIEALVAQSILPPSSENAPPEI